MGRFFEYGEIARGLITSKETIDDLAGRIRELPQFRQAEAVIFGSVAWEAHTWRSDIDIACFSSSHNNVVHAAEDILIEVFGGRAEGIMIYLSLVQVLNGEHWKGAYAMPHISPSTKDHFRQLARAKGWPYNEFLRSLETIPGRKRMEDILEYVGKIELLWIGLQAQIRANPEQPFRGSELRTLSTLEHLPHHLMRKVLGHKKLLPFPDIFPNVKEEFGKLQYNWATVRPLFQPFYDIDRAYRELIVEMKAKPAQWPPERYARSMRQLFADLPVSEVIKVTRSIYARPEYSSSC